MIDQGISVSQGTAPDVVERLKQDVEQLVKQKRHAEKFAGLETYVRVKDPDALIADLVDALTTIASLREQVRNWKEVASEYKAAESRVSVLEREQKVADQIIARLDPYGHKVAELRRWHQDDEHENGNYECLCHNCGSSFTGHKRRVTCRICANLPNNSEPTRSLPESEPTYQGYRSKNIGPQYNSDFVPVNAGSTQTGMDWKLSDHCAKRIEEIDENVRNALINANGTTAGSTSSDGGASNSTAPSETGADKRSSADAQASSGASVVAGVLPGPSETLSPSTARVADREAIAEIVRWASKEALYNGAGNVINPEIFDEAATKISLLDKGGGTRSQP